MHGRVGLDGSRAQAFGPKAALQQQMVQTTEFTAWPRSCNGTTRHTVMRCIGQYMCGMAVNISHTMKNALAFLVNKVPRASAGCRSHNGLVCS